MSVRRDLPPQSPVVARTKPVLSATAALSASSALRITVLSGPDKGLSQVIDRPRILIGRGETADVRLSDGTVSQCHSELIPVADGIRVHDLGSTNGVFFGGVRIERAVVPPGCSLTLGATRLRAEAAGGRSTQTAASFGGLIGSARVMQELYALLTRLARSELSLLLQGETGTGKEVCARAVHKAGVRAQGPFIVLDCAAIPAGLAQSVLFGSERGAFTGATERRIGVFEAAEGGVLFIDEVGELPLDLQPMLLRVLQQREVVPVGSTRPRPVDVRIISATWRDLRELVNQGRFREDLYYRLAQATVWIPALAERQEDLEELVQHSLAALPETIRAARTICPEALQALRARSYPGNVRELRSTVERLALLAEGRVITEADLSFERMLAAERRAGQASPAAQVSGDHPGAGPEGRDAAPLEPFKDAKRTQIDEFERAYLVRLMQRSRDNLTRAAALAGLERQNLRSLLRKHGLYRDKE